MAMEIEMAKVMAMETAREKGTAKVTYPANETGTQSASATEMETGMKRELVTTMLKATPISQRMETVLVWALIQPPKLAVSGMAET